MKKIQRTGFPLLYFLLGTISLLGQSVLLREMTLLFYGNELFWGLGLGFWLLFSGLGSLLAVKMKLFRSPMMLFFLLTGLIFLLPLSVIILRFTTSVLIPYGQLPNIGISIILSGAVLFIFSFPLGLLFSLFTSIRSGSSIEKRVNLGYFWETIGFTFGGILFSFFLTTTSFPLSSKLDGITLRWKFPDLYYISNSKYSRIITTKKGDQFSFFLDGQFAFTSQENLGNRQFLALVKQYISEKKRVLILGSPTIANEINNQLPEATVEFLEIDDVLLSLEKKLLKGNIHPILADPRRFLKNHKNKYSLTIVSLGNPQTLLSNRYFTKEFFQEVINNLSNNGIFVLSLYVPTDYQSHEAVNFASSIYKSLKSVFASVELFAPDDQLIFIASPNILLLKPNNIDPSWLDYFNYQLTTSKRREILDKLAAATVKINSDSEPVSFFYQQLFWQTMYNFQIPQFFGKMPDFLPFLSLIILVIVFNKINRKRYVGMLMIISSFIPMSLEILIIFMFQTKIGHLYSQISLIFSSMLLGMAIGVRTEKIFPNPTSSLKSSFLGYISVIFFMLISVDAPFTSSAVYWLIMILIIGFSGGISFASINRLYHKNGRNPGYIYAFDLFGGCLGAFLTSSFLLPILGLRKLMLFLAAASLLGFISRRRE